MFYAIAPAKEKFRQILLGNSEAGSEQVQYRPQLEPLDAIEGFLAFLRFEHRSKLDQLGIEIGSFE